MHSVGHIFGEIDETRWVGVRYNFAFDLWRCVLSSQVEWIEYANARAAVNEVVLGKAMLVVRRDGDVVKRRVDEREGRGKYWENDYHCRISLRMKNVDGNFLLHFLLSRKSLTFKNQKNFACKLVDRIRLKVKR